MAVLTRRIAFAGNADEKLPSDKVIERCFRRIVVLNQGFSDNSELPAFIEKDTVIESYERLPIVTTLCRIPPPATSLLKVAA